MLKKKLKKSSVALLLGFALLGASVTAYAEAEDSESYWKTLELPTETYNLNTSDRTSTQLHYAKMAYNKTDCDAATVAFHVYNYSEGKQVTSTMYLTGRRGTWEYMNYLSSDILTRGSMTLRAKTASSHTGYYVAGMFLPNGQ